MKNEREVQKLAADFAITSAYRDTCDLITATMDKLVMVLDRPLTEVEIRVLIGEVRKLAATSAADVQKQMEGEQ